MSTGTLQRPRVLVVDDDPDMRAVIAAWLEDAFDVVTARDGVEALAVVDTRPVDVIVLDLMMPVMDGVGFKRALDARGLGIPVILASAAAEVARSARTLGVAGYVVKPLDLERLETMIAGLTGGSGPGTGSPSGSGGAPGGSGPAGRGARFDALL